MTGQASRNPKDRVEGQRVSGDHFILEAKYTATAAEVTADVLQIGQIPVGSHLLPEKCWFFTDGVGGTSIIFTSIGDALDAARYATSDIALTAASTVPIMVVPTVALLLARYPVLATSNIITATTAGTFPMTAGKIIVCHLEYRIA